MKYRVKHITDYIYQSPASLCHNIMTQIPRDFDFQKVVDFKYEIIPGPSYEVLRQDFFGNKYLFFSNEYTHEKLTVTAESITELQPPKWMEAAPSNTQPWEEVASWLRTTNAMNDIRQFSLQSGHVRFATGIEAYAIQSFTSGRPIMEAMMDLNTRIFNDFEFTPGFTDISTPIEDLFKFKKGVCQDLAHFALACIRSIGLSGRYMSGYIETLPPPGKPKLIGADASHAWMSIYIPGIEWVEYDATNNLLVSNNHVRVAVGRDFADVTPLKGIVYSAGEQKMKVSVDVRNVTEEGI